LSSIPIAIRARARQRGVPSLAEAISATGGVAIALGISETKSALNLLRR